MMQSPSQRPYPLFSACGLNCGLCPRYHTDGTSRCPGCGGEGFCEKHPTCGILSCAQRHGVDYCYLCDAYPCAKYDGADLSDSFITHRNQLKDFEKAKKLGLNAYQAELNEKAEILQHLLANYNEGRQKSFFCLGVNLLEMQDLANVMDQIEKQTNLDHTMKEKSAAAVRLFQTTAAARGIMLKLRKKNLRGKHSS